MALFDRLRRPKPANDVAPRTKPRGESGRARTDGFIQPDEINQALVGERGLEVFDEMFRTDADCRRAVMMIVVALAAGTWTVEPYGTEEDETTDEDRNIAEFVRWNLFDNLHGGLIAHVWSLLRVCLRAGFAPFEQIYEVAEWDGRTVYALRNLDLRLPKTIQRWVQDGPDLKAIEQWTPNAGTHMLPMRDLVYYRLGEEGDNWEGEAEDPDTPVPTPVGWARLGDLRPGDEVFAEDGKRRSVVARREWENRPCYEVHFDSGDSIIADANHKWLTYSPKARYKGHEPVVLTTEQMARQGTRAKHGKKLISRHAVPMAHPLRTPPVDLPIDPYVLGYWLGDGTAWSGEITTTDAEVLALFTERGYPIKPRVAAYRFGVGGGLQAELRKLDLLRNKHVPSAYLRSSPEQRLAVLRGLMDSDGNVGGADGPRGRASSRGEFNNTNRGLCEAVLELVRSLGGRGQLRQSWPGTPRDVNGQACDTKPSWRVTFSLTMVPFLLERKAQLYKPAQRRRFHYITEITAVAPRNTVCIEVDAPSHLYLSGRSMVPSHNSLLRPAYKHWKYKSAIELVQAIGIEKSAVGVPTGYPPENASEDDKDRFEEFLANIRANEAAFFMAPGPRADHAKTQNGTQGWFWEFVTVGNAGEGGKRDIEAALNYHTSKIDAVILAEFMRLGQQGEGARATADVQQNPFLALCEGFVGVLVENPINLQLVPRIVDLNFSTDRLPKLSCSLIDSTSLADLGTFVAQLAEKGAIRVEPTLEAYLRKRADLPEADEEAIEKNAEEAMKRAQEMAALAPDKPAPGAKPPAKPGAAPVKPPAKATAVKLDADEPVTLARADRPLKPWEQSMSLDRIEATIDDAQARLEGQAGEQARALAVAMARGQKAKTDELEAAIEATLEGLFVTGRATVVEELERQKLGDLSWLLDAGDNPDEIPDGLAKRMRARAKAMADAIRAAIAAALAAEQFRRGATEASAQSAAETAGMSGLRAQAQQHASSVLNEGRTIQAEAQSEEIAGTRYTSILDGRRCTTCAAADDDVLRPLDDPVRLARIPPNPGCQGGGRCRCLEAFQYRDEQAGDA